jgi:hypothetical protein
MREQIDRWLVGLTVGDVIRATEREEK